MRLRVLTWREELSMRHRHCFEKPRRKGKLSGFRDLIRWYL